MESKSAETSPAISLPKGGGAIKGIGETFQPNLFSGTANFSIPIYTSPGRDNFGPTLNLQYSSGNGNGPFGMGWHLAIPRVTRKTEKGLPRYRDDDVFVWSGAEDLVPVLNEAGEPLQIPDQGNYTIIRYRPRTEGVFARIECWRHRSDDTDVFWKVTTKENITNIYGLSPTARITDPDAATHIYEWLLEETFDVKGNHIKYEYLQEDANQVNASIHEHNHRPHQAYLRRILYGNTPKDLASGKSVGPVRTATDPLNITRLQTRHYVFEVVFDYFDLPDSILPNYDWRQHDDVQVIPAGWPSRPDPFSSFRAGFEIRTLRRCRRVLMLHHFNEGELVNAPLVKTTDFNYAINTDTKLTFLRTATVQGYRKDPDDAMRYLARDMPPVTFKYSAFEPERQTFKSVSIKDDELPPFPLDEPNTALLDIFGDGLPDIVQSTAAGMYVWENLGEASFERCHPQLGAQPPVTLAQSNVAISDFAGDGLVDLVVDAPPMSGFYEATVDGQWKAFKRFETMPSFNLADPNTRLVDLTGDGLADVLVTDDESFLWYRCLGEAGFAEPMRIPRVHDLEEFPDVYFSDSRVRLADLSGDGLNDIVLVHDGRIDYWPNLGYGRFGKRLTMSHTPLLGYQYDPRRLFLVDLDGSGTADLVYLEQDQIRFWFNESGNGWSEERMIRGTPYLTDITSLKFVDFYGTGTTSLVWSYQAGTVAGSNYKVLDFCGGSKPNLLVEMDNNLGATTRIQYAASTKFYLEDKRKGQPWISSLPFPVQVLEKSEVIDHISQTKLTTTYKYHHGYYDGREREFRGFGRVDQYDTEAFEQFSEAGLHESNHYFMNREQAYHSPPVLTKNWFHTGLYFEQERAANGEFYDQQDMLAAYRREYYQGDRWAFAVGDNVVPVTNTPHEACRALRGTLLRSEIYALDGTDKSVHPYTVSETRYEVRELQGRYANQHAVYFPMNKASLTYHYERNPTDPRIQQSLTLEFDDYGNILHSVAIAYPRRPLRLRGPFTSVKQIDDIYGVGTDTYHDIYHSLAAGAVGEERDRRILDFFNAVTSPEEIVLRVIDDPDFGCGSPRAYGVRISLARRILETRDTMATDDQRWQVFDEQEQTRISYNYNRVINKDDTFGFYYIGVPCETKTFEVHGLPWAWPRADESLLPALPPFNEAAFATLGDMDDFLPFEYTPTDELITPTKRILNWSRNYFRADSEPESLDPIGQVEHRLPLGAIESLALPFENYQAAFNASLLEHLYHGKQAGIDLTSEGGYAFEDDYWWVPSGRQAYTPNRFYAVQQIQDAFGHITQKTTDDYALLLNRVIDPLQNSIVADNDYRVLQPRLITDPNGNRSEVAFDALGLVAGTAVMGKAGNNEVEGDSLAGFQSDLSPAQIDDFFASNDPHDLAPSLLGDATSRIIYDLDRFQRSRAADPDDPTQWEPVFAATLTRETHVNDPLPPDGLKIRIGFSYSDGFGREIQQKIQAEPGPVDLNDPDSPLIDPRWLGSGWTIFNNKGKPVRQYEPFFSDTHRFQFAKIVGVSPILFYDPAERVVATLHHNHTYEKVVFDPWRQETWDVNDTVLQTDPKEDPDVGDFFRRLDEDDYLPTWYDRMIAGTPQEQDAAEKSAEHAGTSTLAHFDTLGRFFLTIADNGTDENGVPQKYETQVVLDIEGNQMEIIDPRDNTVMQYDYDMLSNKLRQTSMDAGRRWMFGNVAGNPVKQWDEWDEEHHEFNHEFTMTYDELQRPRERHVAGGDGNIPLDHVYEQINYGDWKDMSADDRNESVGKNLIGKPKEHCDTSGRIVFELYDFKGNLKKTTRRLLSDYKNTPNWADGGSEALLEQETFATEMEYDALNRVIRSKTPDGSITVPSYNDAGLLEKIAVTQDEVTKPFVKNIDYNEKGQRTCILYGNEVQTIYEYDRETFRLVHLKTHRADNSLLQDLYYTYDPVGNITRIEDKNIPTRFFNNEKIEGVSKYRYDPLYRLIEALGREHRGQLAFGDYDNWDDLPFLKKYRPGDVLAWRNYTQSYAYDEAGNITEMKHLANGGSWTRNYEYSESNNRLIKTTMGVGNSIFNYTDYPHHPQRGFMTGMPHLQVMKWNFKEELSEVARQSRKDGGTPETIYYVYDAEGQRVRKVTENTAAPGDTQTKKCERIYVDGIEIYRKYTGIHPGLERKTLHIMDDTHRIAMIETRNEVNDGSPEKLTRYQLGNHLGSATLETDDSVNAKVISYEEYHPYGTTAYQAMNEDIKAAGKRYRYTGKERDEESGLNYHGARYYAPWLGRWTSCDPIGNLDGLNLYSYVQNNVIVRVDPHGTQNKPEPQEMNFPCALIQVLPPKQKTSDPTSENETLSSPTKTFFFKDYQYQLSLQPTAEMKLNIEENVSLEPTLIEDLLQNFSLNLDFSDPAYPPDILYNLFQTTPYEQKKEFSLKMLNRELFTSTAYIHNLKGKKESSDSVKSEKTTLDRISDFYKKYHFKYVGKAFFKVVEKTDMYEHFMSETKYKIKKSLFGGSIGENVTNSIFALTPVIGIAAYLNYKGTDILPSLVPEIELGGIGINFGNYNLPLGYKEDYFRVNPFLEFKNLYGLRAGIVTSFDTSSSFAIGLNLDLPKMLSNTRW